MPKPPSKTASGATSKATKAQSEALARELAGKPYGGSKTEDKAKPISISLPPAMIERLQDKAIANKRSGASDEKTVSAVIRTLLEAAGY